MSRFLTTVGTLLTGVGAVIIAYELHELNVNSKKTIEEIANEDKSALRALDEKVSMILGKFDSSWVLDRSKK
jgi:hypothetical protein